MDIIVQLNFNAARERQDNKCIKCGGPLIEGKIFYWLDEKHNECYCEPCGKEIEPANKEE